MKPLTESLIRGNKKLAETLGVHRNTVSNWKRSGLLDNAIVSDVGRISVFDIAALRMSFKHRRE